MRILGPGSTPTRLGALEPVRQRGAGTCGTVDCRCEREGQTHRGEAPSGRHASQPSFEGSRAVDVIVERCAGLDVHRDNVVATTRVPGSGRRRFDQQTRTFKSTLAGLAELAAWLAEAGVTLVGMEATGVYWKTVFQALEERFECWLLNAQHLRNVPGRKTDVKDSEWICQLVQHGLRPPELRAAAGDPAAARFDAPAQGADQRARPLDPAAGEGASGRRHQANQRRFAQLLEVRSGDA